MSVGDKHGAAPGQGARFNDGKPPFEYVPWHILASWARDAHRNTVPQRLLSAAKILGWWELGLSTARAALVAADWEDLEAAARALGYGAQKYSDWNWALGMKWSVPSACAKRHFGAAVLARAHGYSEADPESAVSHRGHFWCNVIMLAHYEVYYAEGDDRPITQLPNIPRELAELHQAGHRPSLHVVDDLREELLTGK